MLPTETMGRMLQQAQPGWADRPCGLALLHLQALLALQLLALLKEPSWHCWHS